MFHPSIAIFMAEKECKIWTAYFSGLFYLYSNFLVNYVKVTKRVNLV